ncbi:MAG: NAD(P)/FAD-dependent oxidoreductase [Puniceicoccales bacterium]|jgi:phytoene dehydrogenase-like protein|nr:NAD(P)/FAD-dependent oxidoreductase [Puniceicoccales bacterium]
MTETSAPTLHGQHFDAIIIGAGMSGLAAGIRLAHFGKRVLLLERHSLAGGLNSYYTRGKRRFDTGLHALTNYVPPGTKGTPLAKLLRQLRIPHEALALAPQLGSAIHFAEHRIRFTNDFSVLESEIARTFPKQIDAFRRLDRFIRDFHETALNAQPSSAREAVATHILDKRLVDTLFLPLSYYGSARENDMDLPQFAVMWKSIFHEGFARPLDGVYRIIRLLLDKYREAGGMRKMHCGVHRLHVEKNNAPENKKGHVAAIELDTGEMLTADHVFSCAGYAETLRLCSDQAADAGRENIGALSFCETITVLGKQPRSDFGWGETIIFFCDSEHLHYAAPRQDELVDPRSGVICIPNNYDYADGRQLEEGWLRVTALASHAAWHALDAPARATAKHIWHERLTLIARAHLPPVNNTSFTSSIRECDMFTPLTIERFTRRLNGAIYGAPRKCRDGSTQLANLHLCGTDQGFLGIVGAMLSGISIANLHGLKT